MSANFYETDRAVSEYLLFHYGKPEPRLPAALAEAGALDFPARCVGACLDPARLPRNACGLDLGCAVGRGAFELARHCAEVVGIDYSRAFVSVAGRLRARGSLAFEYVEEGDLTRRHRAVVPPDIARARVCFERGDAQRLRPGLGPFDVVVMANLIDRLRRPQSCLDQLPDLVKKGGQLIITSPYTWLETYTPRKNWLGGFQRGRRRVATFDALREILAPHFTLLRRLDLPFVIREHARKFQLSFADASVWIRRPNDP